MLLLGEIKDWMKSKIAVGDGIAVGAIDANKLQYIGVYNSKTAGRQRVCIGGLDNTRYQQKRVTILVHWTKVPAQAEAKAAEVYGLFAGLSREDMQTHRIITADPGGQPVPVGRDGTGVCEYIINVTLTYERMV